MANTLTALAQTLFSGARMVPRELSGLMASVRRDFDDKGVSVGQTVKVPVVPSLAIANVTPSQNFVAGADRTFSAMDFTLNNFKEASWNLTAEEDRLLTTTETGKDILAQTVGQGFRTLINAIEVYLYGVMRVAASRAVGTAGTTPFASDISAAALVRQVLVDNGAAEGDRALVIDTTAGAKLRSLPNLVQFLQSNTEETLRNGLIGPISGLMVRESAAIAPVTKGTGSGYLVNSGGLVIGSTTIPVDTGTGTILAGDSISFAGDTNVYVVKTALSGGNVVIQEPGLRAVVADNTALTVGNNFTPNMAFHRDAVCLVVRPGIQPVGGVAEQIILTDPVTGFSALLLRVVGNSMVSWYLRVVYDAFVPNPFAVAILRG